MSEYVATTTLSTTGTGVVVAVPGFLGKSVEIKASGINGGADSTIKLSLGWGDGTRQNCDSLFTDGTLTSSKKATDRIVSLWDNVAGTLTEIVSASNPVFTATQLKLDVAIVDTNYKISVKITG
jgi:hypothetical protein